MTMNRTLALMVLVGASGCSKKSVDASDAGAAGAKAAPEGVPFDNVVQVAAGQNETCVIDSSGQLYCAGGARTGYHSELTMARPVVGAERTTQMSLGLASCAVQESGAVVCWGYNDHVLPDGTKSGAFVQIPGLASVSHVLTPKVPNPTWALRRDGAPPMQWGGLILGQGFVPPVEVKDFRVGGVVQQVEVGTDFCVRTAAGGVSCWDGRRIAGPEVRFEMKSTPSSLPKKVVDLAAAYWTQKPANWERHPTSVLCALDEDGQAVCWRYQDGLYPNPEVTPPQGGPVPVPFEHPLSGAHGWRDIAMAYEHACGVKRDGSVWCAGRNHLGQLGRSEPVHSEVLLKVSGIENAKAVTVGERHSCALLRSGSVMCWGSNERGQCGTAEQSERAPPTVFQRHKPQGTSR